MFDSSRAPPRASIFDGDSDDDHTETDPFFSRSKMVSSIDSHPAPSSAGGSQNIARMPSPTALLQDHFHTTTAPPAYETPVRSPPQTRPSYDTPGADPWSSTPRTNGLVPVAAPNFPRRTSSIPQSNTNSAGTETASYLLDADHINIQKSEEMEGIMGFKHVNYTLASARRGTQVVRRYSDFAWYVVF
jgi:hypothetical protein